MLDSTGFAFALEERADVGHDAGEIYGVIAPGHVLGEGFVFCDALQSASRLPASDMFRDALTSVTC